MDETTGEKKYQSNAVMKYYVIMKELNISYEEYQQLKERVNIYKIFKKYLEKANIPHDGVFKKYQENIPQDSE